MIPWILVLVYSILTPSGSFRVEQGRPGPRQTSKKELTDAVSSAPARPWMDE